MIDSYRVIYGGEGINAYTVVELHQNGEWVHGQTFYETSDWMHHNVSEYIDQIKKQMKEEK